MSDLMRLTLARTWASRKFGTAMAARIAMMATTMSNSISVKALRTERACGDFMRQLHLSVEWEARKRRRITRRHRWRDRMGGRGRPSSIFGSDFIAVQSVIIKHI